MSDKKQEKLYTPREVAVKILEKAHDLLKKSELAKANTSHEIEIGEEPNNDDAECPPSLEEANIENDHERKKHKRNAKPSIKEIGAKDENEENEESEEEESEETPEMESEEKEEAEEKPEMSDDKADLKKPKKEKDEEESEEEQEKEDKKPAFMKSEDSKPSMKQALKIKDFVKKIRKGAEMQAPKAPKQPKMEAAPKMDAAPKAPEMSAPKEPKMAAPSMELKDSVAPKIGNASKESKAPKQSKF